MIKRVTNYTKRGIAGLGYTLGLMKSNNHCPMTERPRINSYSDHEAGCLSSAGVLEDSWIADELQSLSESPKKLVLKYWQGNASATGWRGRVRREKTKSFFFPYPFHVGCP